MRLDGAHAAVTISGRDKGALTPADVMVVDMDGGAVGTSARPSAETLLHTHLYRRFPEANAVLQRMGKADPMLRQVYLRHIRYRSFYPAKSALFSQCVPHASRWR